MAVVVNPGLDRSGMKFVLTIRMVKFGNVLRRMPFLTQPSLFIRAWDRHRSHWTVTPMARFLWACTCAFLSRGTLRALQDFSPSVDFHNVLPVVFPAVLIIETPRESIKDVNAIFD
ncbi:hypothetical protein QTP70_002052 [Hemibagrus guttatus]|uniref:Uncharacterized protein n=1 Tax=Hemibagrus guttatus TaxID=175788 RepID=A0AAE0QW69_9TELE|nr:hypothetical protein QTP70_002052 [Hemibagrus guttatus]